MMRRHGLPPAGITGRVWLRSVLVMIFLTLAGAGLIRAQSVSFKSLVVTDDLVELLIVEDQIIGGLENGGLLISSRSAPANFKSFTAGKKLSGNRITALAWTGQNVWVATCGGGLTRITTPGPDPAFRQYSQGMGGLSITAVTGTVIGGIERVYYGIADGGVGQIVNGRSGSVLTADGHGLIDDTVLDLEVLDGDLFVATPVGVSRFADGEFTDQNTGLTNLYIDSFDVDADGNLLAAGHGGLYRWDAIGEAWTRLGGMGFWIYQVSCGGGQTWVRSSDGSGGNLLGLWNGVDFTLVAVPFAKVSTIWADHELWLGGPSREDPAMATLSSLAYLARRETAGEFTSWVMDGTLVFNCQGVTIGKDGQIWIGSNLGRAVSAFDGDSWLNIYEIATAENDSSGLFNHGGNVLAMATGADGRIWFNQYGAGALVHDPGTGTTTLLRPDDSPLSGDRIVRIVTHPEGPVFFMHDINDAGLVDVLFDPGNWRNPDSWYFPPTGTPGLGGALTVLNAVVERADIIWFAAEDVGLVRWDVNGDDLGPGDSLTWSDPSDDRWDFPITAIPGVLNDPRACAALASGSDGFLWAGGDGVARFFYDPVTRLIDGDSVAGWDARASSGDQGLVSGSVTDVALDANDDLWVASAGGINRIRIREDEIEIDAWFDLGNYLTSELNQVLYSFNTITNLPGLLYAKLALDSGGRRLLISADTGSALVTIGELLLPDEESLDSLFCYPNPFLPAEAGGGLRLGGFAADFNVGDPALVEIYNLEGQLVYRDRTVSSETAFWDGRNRTGQEAVSGMYVLKVAWHGMTAIRALSLVR